MANGGFVPGPLDYTADGFAALVENFHEAANEQEREELMAADEHFADTDDCMRVFEVCARIYNRLRTK